jgi:hypothetical protein
LEQAQPGEGNTKAGISGHFVLRARLSWFTKTFRGLKQSHFLLSFSVELERSVNQKIPNLPQEHCSFGTAEQKSVYHFPSITQFSSKILSNLHVFAVVRSTKIENCF